MKSDDLLSVQDVAEIFEVNTDTVDQWVRKGVLSPTPRTDPPHFEPKDIHAFFNKQQGEAAGRKRRILIVEDDPLVGNSLKHLLEREGYETALMPIGLAALDLISSQDFDLIISDIRMPGMNGIEALRAIRDLRTQFGVSLFPEIILTAYDDPVVRQEAAAMGICDFVLKPFEIDAFLALVKTKLGVPR